ncbi:methyl-accepting chemotaxis protein [Paraliobacillus ryukyuensis]|uniref:methyl-accepting chemotaxis protein n=1 Tax=Paraliobacillus ryukyuensis TaxID=200904 RepID=UPI0009A63868|nr:methyl-accepting chemotaxis protein [Paraliobacillus ryukyuensis]
MFKQLQRKWDDRGIRSTLTIYFSLIAIIPLLLIGGIAYMQAAHALEKEVGNKVQDFADVHMGKLDRVMYERTRDIQLLANEPAISNVDQVASDSVTTYLDNKVEDLEYFSSLTIFNNSGDLYAASSNIPANYQPAKQTLDLQSDLVSYSNVYYDQDLGETVIAISVPIENVQGETLNLEGTFNIEYIWTDINSISTDNMIVELINQDGEKVADTVSSASISEEESDPIESTSTIQTKLTNIKPGEASYTTGKDSTGQAAVIGYAKSDRFNDYPGFNWSLVVSEPESIALASIASIRNSILVIAVATFLGVILIAFFLSQMIAKPLLNLRNKAQTIAKGDLTDKAKIQGRGEVRHLSIAMNHMVDYLEETIRSTNQASSRVTEQSNALQSLSYQLKNGSDQLNASMQQIASGAEEQASSASQIATAEQVLDEKIKQVRQKAEDIKQSSSGVAELGNKGNVQITNSIEQMNIINLNVKQAVENVNALEKQSAAISKLTDVINNITEQTNLLALNAAIESARAGEAGKGFSVVAGEIRKLAEQVSNSAIDIAQMISSMQEESMRLKSSLEATYQQADKGVHEIQASANFFTEITNEVGNMNQHISSIASNLTSIESNSKDMNNGIEQIASVSEENAANMEEATASIQQQKEAVDYLTQQSNLLEDLATNLNKVVMKFNLK